MNILIPHNWLLQHLETQAEPKRIAELVSLSGPSVENIYQKEGESVYDIEVTTNRVDSMSIRGIAREVAVILEQAGISAKLKPLDLPDVKPDTDQVAVPEVVNDDKLNKRTMFVVLKNVQRADTPDWMAHRLRQIELNVHDAVIDITNYITHELGHPCHAFDYDKLMATGGKIIITEAGQGETFSTLDGESFTTVGGEVVFKNGEGEIIDLPSIKGTANTSIDENTKNVMLLMESIAADKVRFASMTHAIRTTAAQLMEKNTDPKLADDVMKLGVKLYQELCQAQVASEVVDHFPGRVEPETVTLAKQVIDNYLGIELPADQIKSILEKLGCKVNIEGETINVTPPTFRSDIKIPADVVEEIARIYGYHNLPSKLMDTPIPTQRQEGTDFDLEARIKRFLANIGWQELYTYSMVSEEIARQSGHPATDHVAIQNPLTEDRIYMRRSLLPSLEEALDANSRHEQLSFFEMAYTYHPRKDELPDQNLELALVTSNDYLDLKGAVESLLDNLYIENYSFEIDEEQLNQFKQSASIKSNGFEVGKIGILSSGKSAAVLQFSQLLALAQTHPQYKPIPKTAPVFEDMTFSLPEKISVAKVEHLISEVDPLIYGVRMKDQYQNNVTFKITYLDPLNNLSVKDVEPIRKRIAQTVKDKYNADLVGAV